MSYLFSDTIAKARKNGYTSLTETEKWEWHADIYGFRQVALFVPREQRGSPCDPDGQWYDEYRARIAENYYRDKHRNKNMKDEAAENANYERLRRLRDEMDGIRQHPAHIATALGVTARETPAAAAE